MALFSERSGYTITPLQLESMTPELRNRIWNVYGCEVCSTSPGLDSRYMEEIMDYFGMSYVNIYSSIDIMPNLDKLRKWFGRAEWYRVLDFIEVYLSFLPKTEQKGAIENFNRVFVQENAGYRVVGTIVMPITNDNELKTVETAQSTIYETVNIFIKKAAELFSRRPNPDYENSIKESISAIEALCCIITGNRKATLGDAMKQLDSKGIVLHKAFISAISSLYGYTSDEGGIRHGSIDFAGTKIEDARYMLISCSAFVNYLIEKWESVK